MKLQKQEVQKIIESSISIARDLNMSDYNLATMMRAELELRNHLTYNNNMSNAQNTECNKNQSPSIWLHLLFLLYIISAVIVCMLSVIMPLSWNDYPSWLAWLVYPVVLIIAATQFKVLNFFKNKNVL